MSSLSSGYGLSSSLKEVMTNKKQGIVSILGSDCERAKTASLRRTLSADMSSKRWQAQHGFIPFKRIASSKELIQVSIPDSSFSSEAEEEYEEEYEEKQEQRGQFDIWSSIQEEKKKENKEEEKQQPGQFDIWSSIISQKVKEDANNLPPPYVHPLVKRSASSLSEKSLEICTESLGSETGSDGFSSNTASEAGDSEEDKEEEQEVSEQEQQKVAVVTKPDVEDWLVAKYNLAAVSRKSQPRSFPPPIPSRSSRDGASVHIRSRRNNGRLVLEAVSVPSQNNFRAERQDGRLVLTFIDSPSEVKQARNGELNAEENDVEQFEVEIENYGVGMGQRRENGEEEQVEEIEEEEIPAEKAPKLSSGVMGMHRVALMMNKPMVLANKDRTWPKKFNEIVKFGKQEAEEEEEEMVVVERITPASQSLPPRHPVARMMTSPQAAATATAVTSLNAYEYFWKPKRMVPAREATEVSVYSPIGQKPLSYIESDNNNRSSSLILSKSMGHERQEMMVFRGNKRDFWVPLPNGCKEPGGSYIFLEPHCIATS